MKTIFESTRFGECDSCMEQEKLNEHSLCEQCHVLTEAFDKGVQDARRAGLTREEAFKAGMAAQMRVATNPATYQAKGEAL